MTEHVFVVNISQISERKQHFYFEDAFCWETTFTFSSSQVTEGEPGGSSVDQTECKTIVALTCQSEEESRPKETKDEDSLHSGSLSNICPLKSEKKEIEIKTRWKVICWSCNSETISG